LVTPTPEKEKSPPPRGRRTGTTKASQRAVSIDLLLQAALRLFVSQGYRSTNLEQIAGEAHLTKGAVYFYFGSKETVLLELLRRVEDVVVDRAIATVERMAGSATDRLVAYMHYQANLGITHDKEVLLLILMSLEFKEREGEVQTFIQELYGRQRGFIEALIGTGQKNGEFRTDVPVREMSAIIEALNDGTFLEWFRRRDHLGGSDLTRGLRTTMLNGILAPAAMQQQPAHKATGCQA
jgi:AcrR family transcriptional regulator